MLEGLTVKPLNKFADERG